MASAKSFQYQTKICDDVVLTIANGQAESSAGDLRGTTLVAFDLPAGFQGTEITFKVSSDGTNYFDYKRMEDGLAVKALVSANASFATVPDDFAGYRYIKFVSNANQTSDISIQLKTLP